MSGLDEVVRGSQWAIAVVMVAGGVALSRAPACAASGAAGPPATTQSAPAATMATLDAGEWLPTTRPAKPALPPSPSDSQAARKRIWARFRGEYDKDSDADRSALGHKLLKSAVRPQTDDRSRFALLHEACDLAASGHDKKLAAQSAEAISFFFDVDPVAEEFQALSAGQWPQDTEQSCRELMDDWVRLSEQAVAVGNYDIAEAAATRAIRIARHWGDEQWVMASSNQLSKARAAREQRARLQTAIKMLAVHPDDPKANLIVGAHAAAEGSWDKALPMLERSGDAVVRLAATKDLEGPKEAAAQIAVAEAWTAAAQRQPPDVADAFYRRARRWYESALPLLPEQDRARIRDRMKNLPGGSI